MRPLSIPTLTLLKEAVVDRDTLTRYWSHVAKYSGVGCIHIWTGALSGKGHGRFWLGDVDGRSITIIAHRFRYALDHGVDALVAVEVLSHKCDNPLCQTIECLTPKTNADNRREWAQRRHSPNNPLRDLRGARGRARAIRDAARSSGDIEHIGKTGLGEDIYQEPLW